MSYILDALRRADQQRQRHTLRTPTLGHDRAPVARPARSHLARVSMVTLSATAIAVGTWLVWKYPWPVGSAETGPPSSARVQAPVRETGPQTASTPASGIMPGPGLPRDSVKSPPAAPRPLAAPTAPGSNLAATTEQPARVIRPPPPSQEVVPSSPTTAEPARSTHARAVAAIAAVSVAEPRTAAHGSHETATPMDGSGSTAGRVTTDPEAIAWHDLPSEQRRGLPRPRLDVHVYAEDPAARFVMVGMRKYQEGDALPDGSLLERIDVESIQLEYRGQHYTLPRH